MSKQKIVLLKKKKKQNTYRTTRSRISHLYCDIGAYVCISCGKRAKERNEEATKKQQVAGARIGEETYLERIYLLLKVSLIL